MTATTDYEPLWQWIRERELIRIRKDRGDPPPWTPDPILAAYRFCCVRREDDRVTRWIRAHIREAFAGHPLLWLMLCIGRQINWPDTLAELIADKDAWPRGERFSPARLASVLRARRARGEKVYTGAYVISAPAAPGADKATYVAEVVIGDLWRRRDEFARPLESLAHAHRLISASNGWGTFMAYQAVVDMRYTDLLRDAPDVRTWAAAGPGTLRGLCRVHGRALDARISQAQAQGEIRAIYELAEARTGVAMDLSDVPNALCELDKYLRVARGEGRPRARYVPGRGA